MLFKWRIEYGAILAVWVGYKPRGKPSARLEEARKYWGKRRNLLQYGLKAARRAPQFSKR